MTKTGYFVLGCCIGEKILAVMQQVKRFGARTAFIVFNIEPRMPGCVRIGHFSGSHGIAESQESIERRSQAPSTFRDNCWRCSLCKINVEIRSEGTSLGRLDFWQKPTQTELNESDLGGQHALIAA